METILITGGSGLIGSRLIPMLKKEGYRIRVLSRSQGKVEGAEVFLWDVEKGTIDPKATADIDHIIHLAGYSVSSDRWNARRKKLIYDSRIKAIQILKESLGNQSIKSFISASGVSIYGTKTSEHIFQEADALKEAKDDFLADVSIHWEKAAEQFKSNANRVVLIRTPVALGDEGALPRIARPIKMGIGSPLGDGKQWVPWIHIDDIAAAYLFAIQQEKMQGAYNVSAIDHITNADLTRAVANTLNKKLWAPKVPSFVLYLLFGKMANIILKGSRVDNTKLKNTGFELNYPTLEKALENLLHD